MVGKWETITGLTAWARPNSVRAAYHWEKWSRLAWYTREASGTRSSWSRSWRRSTARPTSVRSGRRNTKSPKPKFSRMKVRRSASRVWASLCRKVAPSSSTRPRLTTSVDWRRMGRSGSFQRTWRASSMPAAGSRRPSRGKLTSEMMPSRLSP